MENHLRSEPVVQALNMALHQRRPSEVVHHSELSMPGGRGARIVR